MKNWILEFLPEHKDYIEPFAASAPILLAKRRAAGMEVYNDLDGLWANSFRVARDHGEELARQIEATPYSREEFDHAYVVLKNWQSLDLDPIEIARLHLVKMRQGFGGTGRTWSRSRPGGPDQAKLWTKLPLVVCHAFERLQGVHIECRDYRDVIEFYDGPQTTFYLDPPYVGVEEEYYHANKGVGFDHMALRNAVMYLKGAVVISYYEGDVEKLYEGWKVYRRPVKVSVGQDKLRKTEILLIKSNSYARSRSRDIFPD